MSDFLFGLYFEFFLIFFLSFFETLLQKFNFIFPRVKQMYQPGADHNSAPFENPRPDGLENQRATGSKTDEPP